MTLSMLLKPAIGALIGAAVGFGIYKFVGCRTGACPLQANPYVSMIVWAVFGAMIVSGK